MKQIDKKGVKQAVSTAPMTLRHGWHLLINNLKEWHSYLQQRRTQPHQGLRGTLKAVRSRIGKWFAALRKDLTRSRAAIRHHAFPESDLWPVRLLLFFAGSIPYVADRVRHKIHLRRKKRTHIRATLRSYSEKIKLHPVTFLTSALGIAAVCALLSIYTVGTNVNYGGYNLGTVSSRHTVRKVISDLEETTCKTLHLTDYTVDTEPLQLDTRVIRRHTLESREDFSDQLAQQLGMVEYANVLYINDEPVVATTYEGALEELLEQLKIGYITADTVECSFKEQIEIRQEYVDADLVMNLGYVAEILNETKSGEVSYTVEAGDAPYGICDKFGLSFDDLKAINPGYDWSVIRVGDVLTISNAVPYLTVKNVERQNYIQDVPYEIEYEDDDSMYQGEYKVLSEGVFGKRDVSANVTYINGEETQREVVSSSLLSQPVTELQKRGTKERPSWFPTGSFGWPCNGVITSRFGYRNTGIPGASTYHEGIDIANGKGTPIYASDGGTVTHSGWSGGYGYLVIIDHGNGYQTYYGHNSALLVSVGDHVYKGQQIAKMGSTGVSSGSHCDFRIKYNGTFLNPLNFL